MPRIERPPEPWRSFFDELDARLNQAVHLHCCGSFVVTQVYGVARTTIDVDFLGVVPANVQRDLADIAGKESALRKKHKVYLDPVTVVTYPENYQERLIPLFPGAWAHLWLHALEAHDLALSKLERNLERDRDDVQRLASAGHLKPEILKERYLREFRPHLLAHEERHDLTLQLWLESYWTAKPQK